MSETDTKTNLNTNISPPEESDESVPDGLDHQAHASETTVHDSSIEDQEPEILDEKETIKSLSEALSQKNEDFLRAKAETDNVRRRAVEERVKAKKFGIETLASDLLPVVDALSAALDNPDAKAKKILEGVEMTKKLLTMALEKNAIKEILAENEKFDPAQHQAVGTESVEGEPGRVIKVLQTGYSIHERILRPTMVIVSKEKDDHA